MWNVAGVNNIEEDSWMKIRKHEIEGLVETWAEKEKEKMIREKLRDYKCFFNRASRERKK